MLEQGVAIIGMACEYPDASSPTALWLNSLAGRQSFRPIPEVRLRTADYSRDPTDPDSLTATHAAVISNYTFPREKFGISGNTYRSTDLAHWLALDVADRALRDAGLTAMSDELKEQTTAIVGNTLTGEFSRARAMRAREPIFKRMLGAALDLTAPDVPANNIVAAFQEQFRAALPAFDSDTLAGSLANTIAGRICNYFNFGGGGYTIDGACASSLLAVISGARSLDAREARIALVGGVDLSLDPFELMGFSRVDALSKSSSMRVFDSKPTGFIPGEGAGFLVLVRADDPLIRDIAPYAIIRGWGIASDGSGGIARPEVAGQRRSLQRAYDMAEWDFGTIGYIEAHGTATAVGDETELRAIHSMTESASRLATPIVVSSIKANIGHTKAAAGIAGLIRAVAAVSHGVLPPLPGPASHPLLRNSDQIRRLTQAESWVVESGIRRAGVSSMGFGGINTHMVIEQPLERPRVLTSTIPPRFTPAPHVLTATGATRDEAVNRLAGLLDNQITHALSSAELGDCAARSRENLNPAEEWRAAVVAHDVDQFLSCVAALRNSDAPTGRTAWIQNTQHSSIGIVFAGQGGGTVSATDSMGTSEATHSALAAAIIAAMNELSSARIVADMAVGHSLGELAALAWAGVWEPDQFGDVASLRGSLLDRVPLPHGGMINISAPHTEIASVLPPGCTIAAHNGTQTVVAGLDQALSQITDLADHYGWEVTRLAVTHAFHTDVVHDAAIEFATRILPDGKLHRQVFSTVTGRALGTHVNLADHLQRQMLQPVLFEEALHAAGATTWIVITPCHASMGGLVRDITKDAIVVNFAAGTSLVDAPNVVAAAWVAGCDVDWKGLDAGRRIFAKRTTAFNHLTNPCESVPLPGSFLTPTHTTAAQVERTESIHPDTDRAVGLNQVKEIVLRTISEKTELPADNLHESMALSGDLHLNSIVIGQLVAEIATKIGIPVPLHVNDFASATIGTLIGGLINGPTQKEDNDNHPAPAAAWTALFEAYNTPVNQPSICGINAGWTQPTVVDLGWKEMATALTLESTPPNTLLLVAEAPQNAEDVWRILRAINERAPKIERVALVERARDYSAAPLLRTLALESPDIRTTVIRCTEDVNTRHSKHIAHSLASADDHTEYGFDGTRFTQNLLRRIDLVDRPDFNLGPDDRVLISGGARGLGFATAEYLTSKYGTTVELLGRTSPDAPEITDALKRIRLYGGKANYHQVDITDAASVQECLRTITSGNGIITGVFHSAGINAPASMGNLTKEQLTATIAVKVNGADNLMAALDMNALKVFIAFSSIIARTGLHGEAHYAIGNDWLNAWMSRLRAGHPHIRAVSIEWSVWAGMGMGHQLGVLDQLRRSGVDPIAPRKGIELLDRIIRAQCAPPVVVATGRFGTPSTILLEPPASASGRFLGRTVAQTAGCELITDTVISAATDPYLLDHQIDGNLVMPLVMLLEASAQHAAALTSRTEPPKFEHIRIQRAITVPRFGESTLRICATRLLDDTVAIAIRSSQSKCQYDHLRLVCTWGTAEAEPLEATSSERDIEIDPQIDLYGLRLFQSGRLTGIERYKALSGTNFMVDVSSTRSDPESWFSRGLPTRLLLGSPTIRDCGLQAAQGCLPDRVLLPTRIRSIEFTRTLPSGGITVLGSESYPPARAEKGFTFDIDFCDKHGVYERWRGVNFHPLNSKLAEIALPPGLAGPLIERRLVDLQLPWVGAIAISTDSRTDWRTKLEHALVERRRPWGKLLGDQWFDSYTHAEKISLAVTATKPVGVDLALESDFITQGMQLNGRDSTNSDPPERSARLWAAREAYFKATGQRPAHRFLEDGIYGEQVLLRHDDCRVWTSPLKINGSNMYVAIAIDGSVYDA